MLKHTTLLTLTALLVVTGTAMADGSTAASSTTRIVEFTPEQVRAICTPDTSSAQAAESAPASAEVESCCERLQKQIDSLRAGLRTFRQARARLERRVALLERPEHAEAAAIVQKDIEKVDGAETQFVDEMDARFKRELEPIWRKLDDHEFQIALLQDNDTVQDGLIEAHSDQIEVLQRASKFADFGFNVGALTLAGWDYTNVSGVVGVQLSLRISDRWYWYGAPALLVTAGDHPFGTMFQTGIGYDLTPSDTYSRWSLEFGGMMTSTLLNSQFEGKYVTIEPTIGAVYRFPKVFRMGLLAHGGPRADREGDLSASAGALLVIGADLGSRD